MTLQFSKHGPPFKKDWGTAEPIWDYGSVYLDKLTIDKDGRSSRHRHANLTNVFAVASGRVRVFVWDGSAKRGPRKVILSPKADALTIPPGVFHRFHSLEPSVVFELCRAAAGIADREDIERVK